MKTILPTIKLGNITLREICEADYLDYFEIGRDIETTRHLNWGPFIYPNDALWVIREIFFKRPNDGIPKGYAIVKNNKMIGMIDYHTYYKDCNTAEIGYVLNKSYWNQGIMSKCLKAVTKLGFEYHGLDKIIVGHTISNEASKNVILKCGYKYEFQRFADIKGVDELAYYYALYKYEYFY